MRMRFLSGLFFKANTEAYLHAVKQTSMMNFFVMKIVTPFSCSLFYQKKHHHRCMNGFVILLSNMTIYEHLNICFHFQPIVGKIQTRWNLFYLSVLRIEVLNEVLSLCCLQGRYSFKDFQVITVYMIIYDICNKSVFTKTARVVL